jgi:O-antigen/teichoic acid export membrane protein
MRGSTDSVGDLKARSARGLLWTITEKWGVQLCSLLTLTILANLLQVGDFGLIAMAGVFLALLNLVSDQGIGVAIVQRQELDEAHLDSAFWANLALGVLLAGTAIATAGLVASFYREPRLILIIACLSARFLVQPFSVVPRALLARRLQFRETALRSLVSKSAGGIVGVILALSGWGVWSLVAQELTGVLAEAVVLWRVTSWRPHWRFSRRHWLELLGFGVRITGLSLISFLHYQVAPLLLGYLAGPVALGYYSVGFRMLQALLQMLQGMAINVALPTFSRLQSELARLRQLFYESSSLVSLVAFPIFGGIIVTAPELIAVLFGPKWATSAPVLQVLAASGFAYAMLAPSGPMLLALNKPAWSLRLSVLEAVVNLTLLLPAVQWGIVAVAGAHTARSYLLAPVHFYAQTRLLGTDWRVYLRGIAPSAVGALSMMGGVLLTRALLPGWLGQGATLAILVALGALVYAVVLYRTGPTLLGAMRDFAGAALRPPASQSVVDWAPGGSSTDMGSTLAREADPTRTGPPA